MLFSSVLAVAVALIGPSLAEASPNPAPAPAATVATFPVAKQGCFDSLSGFKLAHTEQYQAASICATRCVPLGKPVMAINGTDCWCSDTLPPTKNAVDLSKCDQVCPGYGDDKCMWLAWTLTISC